MVATGSTRLNTAPARQLFVCVYRRHIPSRREWERTRNASATDLRLGRYLDEYWRPDRYFDWGDDPAFFCAQDEFGDPTRASWAVCRPDVRDDISVADAVAFFNAKPAFEERQGSYRGTGPVDYFFIGCGTVDHLIDRRELWSNQDYATYRGFYNVLARPGPTGALHNVEVVEPHHSDWERRATAPVVLFATGRSRFELTRPLHVAHFEPAEGVPEKWNRDRTSLHLEQLLFGDGRARRLRTSRSGYQHAKRVIRLLDAEFDPLIDELLGIAGGRRF